ESLALVIENGSSSDSHVLVQMIYRLFYRLFVDLAVDDPVWTPETFSMNRDRLFTNDIAKEFFSAIVGQARKKGLVSKEHFSVDGTLLRAWASHKSFRPKGEDGKNDSDPDNFHGEQRSNSTHTSTTDPDARLYKKSRGSASELCYLGHVLMEN